MAKCKHECLPRREKKKKNENLIYTFYKQVKRRKYFCKKKEDHSFWSLIFASLLLMVKEYIYKKRGTRRS